MGSTLFPNLIVNGETIPHATTARVCLNPWLIPIASKTQIGVSKPTKWPKKITKTPT